MKKLFALAVVIAVSIAVAVPALAAVRGVRVEDNEFSRNLTVNKGDTVRWRWVGDNPHNVTVRRGPVRFRSSTKRTGTYSKRMRVRGRYRIVCTIHPGMDMTLRVR